MWKLLAPLYRAPQGDWRADDGPQVQIDRGHIKKGSILLIRNRASGAISRQRFGPARSPGRAGRAMIGALRIVPQPCRGGLAPNAAPQYVAVRLAPPHLTLIVTVFVPHWRVEKVAVGRSVVDLIIHHLVEPFGWPPLSTTIAITTTSTHAHTANSADTHSPSRSNRSSPVMCAPTSLANFSEAG
jgi:hypothetical protein